MATEVLTTKQAAELLQLSEHTVKVKAATGELPASKVGRQWRFMRDELEAWLRAGGSLYEARVDAALLALVRERMPASTGERHDLADVKRELGL